MADDRIRIEDKYYIQARSSVTEDRTLVLKHGDTFAVFDRHGNMRPYGLAGHHGLYHADTRFLSHSALRLCQNPLLLLSSTVTLDNALLTVDLTNPDIKRDGDSVIPRGTLHISRSRFIWQNTCYDRLRMMNFSRVPVRLCLELSFDADFADIFEVRGTARQQRGRLHPPDFSPDRLLLSYEGLDGMLRRTRIQWSLAPQSFSDGAATFELLLPPGEAVCLELSASCESSNDRVAVTVADAATALTRAAEHLAAAASRECHIYTSNDFFNHWLNRSIADLRMMTTATPAGPFPYAGVPWYSTPFGRDAILTAYEALWINPDWARGVLSYLAQNQATELDPPSDAQPGKILHESRQGEMAVLREVPFRQYYGSVDSTPLFVMLAAAFYRWSGEREFIASIWPNIERALEWMDRWGDPDGDGFVDYARMSPTGLVQQGWKDSHDAIFHADGSSAEPPIALCEVQAYVYAAKNGAAQLADLLGRREQAERLVAEATALRERFEAAFWSDKLQCYALALDGSKQPCFVRTSNAGQCLFAGIASPDRARRIAHTLMSDDSFSGWGIRTVAAGEARYNPMSYHNGSVWPHDNALIADGFSRYGFKDLAVRILTGLFDASLFVELNRMPELFCGFHRRPGEGPTLYPVACSPQSWAAAAVFLLLRACLGMSADPERHQLRLHRPVLPAWLKEVQIKNLRVGAARVDLQIHRYAEDVGIQVLRREGPLEIIAVK